jgi:hypothetical protein
MNSTGARCSSVSQGRKIGLLWLALPALLAVSLWAWPGGGLEFKADSGTITAPFVATNGCISQPVTTTSPTNGGRAAYTFTIAEAGNYVVQGSVQALHESANSFYVNMDAEPTDPGMIWDIPVGVGFTNRIVFWRGTGTTGDNEFAPKVFSLTAGAHQLIIRGREANVQLESISVVRDPSVVAKPPAPTGLHVVAPN